MGAGLEGETRDFAVRTFGHGGKLGIEEKYMMRKRNLASPDRADAIVGVMAQRDYAQYAGPVRTIFGYPLPDEQNELEPAYAGSETSFLRSVGAECGFG